MSAAFDNKIPKAISVIERDASALVKKTLFAIEADIKLDMTAQKHGRTYKRGAKSSHTASAPGEAPAVDTGALINSVAVVMDGRFAGEVGSDKEYAAVLEEGGAHLEARPAWKKAGAKAKNTFQRNAGRL